MSPPSSGTVKRNPFVSLLGAIAYGRRPDDAAARKKMKRIAGAGTASAMVLWLLTEMWGVTKTSIYDERDQHRLQLSTIVDAMKEQTSAIKEQTRTLETLISRQDHVNAILIDRIQGPLPAREIPPARTIRPR